MTLNWLEHGGFSDVQPGLLTLEQNQQLYDLAAPLKPKYWRIMAGWNYIAKQPDPGPAVTGPTYDTGGGIMYQPPTTRNRDWSTLDRCVNNIIRQVGSELIIMVGQNRPRYGGGQGSGGLFQLFGGFASLLSGGLFGALSAGMTSRVTAEDYGDFAAEVADRYRPGGLGIAPDLRAAGKGVTFYEGWNEPNSKYTWVKNVEVKLFVEYQRELYNSIKAVTGLSGTGSKILIGGMTHVPQGGAWYGDGWLTEQEIDFIKKSYDLGIQPYFDAMSIHPYTGQDARLTGYAPDLTDNAIVQAGLIRDEMVARGDSSKPVYITEFGFSTALCTEAEQAEYQQQAFELVRDNMPWVEMYLVYCLRDSGTNPRALNQTLGALRPDMTPKPLYDYLLSLTPEVRDFNLGMTLSFGAAAAPQPAAGFDLGMTLSLGMAGVGQPAATFDLGMTLSLGMAAAEQYAATFSLPMTLTLGMSAQEQGAPSTFDLGMTLSLGMAAAATYTRNFDLGMTLALGMAAAERYAAAFSLPMTLSMGFTGADLEAGSFNLGMTLSLGMAGALAAQHFNTAFSGSTKPSGGIDFGENNVTSVSSGTMQEGTTKLAVNGTYYSGWLSPDVMATSKYTARANSGALQSGTSRGIGIVVAAADDGAGNVTKAVIGIMSQTTAAGAIILSWDGSAWTQRAAATGSGMSAGTSDDVGIRISESGGIYTYTLQKNQVDTTVSWTDSGGVIGVPGKRWGPGFKRIRASGVQSASPGVDEIWSDDT